MDGRRNISLKNTSTTDKQKTKHYHHGGGDDDSCCMSVSAIAVVKVFESRYVLHCFISFVC
jgi:hypothetical protein